MARRRCFSVDVIESEAFRKLSKDAKNLYFGLIAHSDDEGVVINPAIPMCLFCIDEKALKELIESGFLLKFEDLLVIKHWYIHNKIYGTKKRESAYSEELSKLFINSRFEYEVL